MAIQPGWGKQWETLANAINDYYGGGAASAQYQNVVNMLNSGNYTMDEMESILANIPEFSRTYNSNGELINVSYNVASNSATSSAGSIAQQVNSNVANSTKTQFSVTQNVTKNSQTGKVTLSDNVIKYKTGQLAPTTMKSVPISAVQGVLAASVGITVGKTISQAAYNSGFNWLSWAGVDMESLNPQTWNTITDGDDSLNAKLFNMILGLDPDTNDPQPYIDEMAFAYMVAYMDAVGVFDETGKTGDLNITSVRYPIKVGERVVGVRPDCTFEYWCDDGLATGWTIQSEYPPYGYHQMVASSNPNAKAYSHRSDSDEPDGWDGDSLSQSYTYDGRTVYYLTRGGGYSSRMERYSPNLIYNSGYNNVSSDDYGKIAWVMIYGDTEGVIGIDDQASATQFNPSGIDPTNIASVLLALKAQYPELWENRVEFSPDGDALKTYIPVGFPTGGIGQQPSTNGATQSALAPDISGDGDSATDELIKTLIDAIQQPKTQAQEGMESNTNVPTKPVDPNGDPRGIGQNPPIVTPVGSASALWKIYNPSQSQLDTFGAWLWSSDFVDQLLKLFNDPMQAIIGLHKVYCTPPTSGSGPIKVGYLVSDASANYVSSQYTEIDCGSVNIAEHFNNAFDYDEFTRISIFLPFIGFEELDVKDIMRSSINVKYGVDVLTGACLAKITVTRDLNSPILYTFAGNCAVQYPVSSGSYIGIITGLCSLIGGVAGSIATGGALAPALVGATAGLPRMHTTVEHSGAISANAGALGPKKPYIVIQRPQTQMPLNGVMIEGRGQNETVSLGSLNGYVKVKKADLMGIPATGSELDEIRDLLEDGIYMN